MPRTTEPTILPALTKWYCPPVGLVRGQGGEMNREYYEAVKDLTRYNVPESIKLTAIHINKVILPISELDGIHVAILFLEPSWFPCHLRILHDG